MQLVHIAHLQTKRKARYAIFYQLCRAYLLSRFHVSRYRIALGNARLLQPEVHSSATTL